MEEWDEKFKRFKDGWNEANNYMHIRAKMERGFTAPIKAHKPNELTTIHFKDTECDSK